MDTNVTIQAQVYLDIYGNIRLYDTEQELEDVFQQFGKNGTVFNLNLTIKKVGKIGFCDKKAKYDYDCHHRLNPDGKCPAEADHIVPAGEELSPELQEMAEELSK